MCRWQKSRFLRLHSPIVTTVTKVRLLGYAGDIYWEKQDISGISIDLHKIPAGELSNNKAWTFVLENVK